MADYDLPKKTVQSGPFPHETYIQPFWRSELHPLDDHRSTEDLPTECDILIVGAGYAGVTTAYHLLNENPDPPSIVLLEARQACSGATARNGRYNRGRIEDQDRKPSLTSIMSRPGGHVRPEIYFYMPEYIKKYGLEMAAAISNFEISHVQALKDLVEKEQIDCDFTLGRSMDVFLDEAQAVEAKGAYDELKESGLVSLKDVQYTSAKNAEIVSTPFLRSCLVVVHSLPLGNLTYFRFLASEARKDALVSQLPTFGHTNSSCTSSPLLLRAASTYKLQHRYYQWPPRLIRPMGNGSLQPHEV